MDEMDESSVYHPISICLSSISETPAVCLSKVFYYVLTEEKCVNMDDNQSFLL